MMYCKPSAVLFLVLLRVEVQSQTVQKTIRVLEGNSTSVPCELDLGSCRDPDKCVLWIHKGPDDDRFKVGKCSSECGSCNHCPYTQPEQCNVTSIYFEDTQRSCTAIYQCQFYEDTTQPSSYRAKLDVHYPPGKLTISDSRPIAIQGRPFELSCQMNDLGNPEAEIAWQPDTDGVIAQGRGSSTIRFESVDHRTIPRELKCYPKQDGGLVSEDVLQNLGDSAIWEISQSPHISTAKTTEMAAIVGAGIQPETSPKDREVFTMAVIMSCVFGGVMFLCVVIIAAWVYNKRTSQRTSQLQETGTSLSGDDNSPQQETSLPILLPEYSSQSIDTGFTSETDPTPSAVGVGLPVQVSSIHPNLQEPNFNPRVPIMVSLKTTTPQHAVSQNTALGKGEKNQASPKFAATENTPDRILLLNEETCPKDEVKVIKRWGCEPVSSLTYVGRATRPKSVANARKREEVRSSVSLDESTPSEPHTLCSSLPDSVSCPELDEMISGKSTA